MASLVNYMPLLIKKLGEYLIPLFIKEVLRDINRKHRLKRKKKSEKDCQDCEEQDG